MTQEEIIEVISDDKMMPFIQPEPLVQIVEFVINNYRPSIPYDLDEAAIPESEMAEWMKYGPHTNYPWCSVPDAIKITAEHFFARGKQIGAEYTIPRWISVDERLPEMDEEVIVLTDELGTAPIYKIAFGHIVDVKRCIDYNGWNCPGVKYWMPCPEIPNND